MTSFHTTAGINEDEFNHLFDELEESWKRKEGGIVDICSWGAQLQRCDERQLVEILEMDLEWRLKRVKVQLGVFGEYETTLQRTLSDTSRALLLAREFVIRHKYSDFINEREIVQQYPDLTEGFYTCLDKNKLIKELFFWPILTIIGEKKFPIALYDVSDGTRQDRLRTYDSIVLDHRVDVRRKIDLSEISPSISNQDTGKSLVILGEMGELDLSRSPLRIDPQRPGSRITITNTSRRTAVAICQKGRNGGCWRVIEPGQEETFELTNLIEIGLSKKYIIIIKRRASHL